MARSRKPANMVGPNIRKLRQERGWTQEEFAGRCQVIGFDISRATVSQIEAQLRCVKDDEILRLANVLSVSPNDLFGQAVRSARKH